MKKINILGVDVNDVSLKEATDIVLGWLKSGGKHYIVTTNPEFIMAAQKDLEFKKILNSADLAIPDGTGLKIARPSSPDGEANGGQASDIVNTIPGIDLMERLCKEASDYGFTTGFLGGQNGVADKTAKCLQKKYPKLKVVFTSDGGAVDNNGNVIARNEVTRQSTLEDRHASLAMTEKVDLLFVAFGQVKQEKWIVKNLPKIPVKVAMGVGGAFDYLSGSVARAPIWMRNMGLEWLFRLILQPWRIKRQLQLLNFVILSLRGAKRRGNLK